MLTGAGIVLIVFGVALIRAGTQQRLFGDYLRGALDAAKPATPADDPRQSAPPEPKRKD